MRARTAVRRKGFTLMELLVALGIIAILMGMGIRSYSSLMGRIKDASSQAKLAAVNVALSMYGKDQGQLPPDGENSNLFTALADYDVGESLLANPYNGESFQEFYVKRSFNEEAGAFVIASPSVREGKTMVLLSGSQPQKLTLREVTHKGTSVEPGEKVTGGVLNFGRGTTVAALQGTEMTLVHSFELADGTPYGLVRVDDPGRVVATVNKNDNWKFEIITPAAISGVEGTMFAVQVIDADNTRIEVMQGTVRVTERMGMGSILVNSGESVTVRIGDLLDDDDMQ